MTGKRPYTILLIASVAVAATQVAWVGAWLKYDRVAIANGAMWRIVMNDPTVIAQTTPFSMHGRFKCNGAD